MNVKPFRRKAYGWRRWSQIIDKPFKIYYYIVKRYNLSVNDIVYQPVYSSKTLVYSKEDGAASA